MDYSPLIATSSCTLQLLADIAAGRAAHAYMLCGEDTVTALGAAEIFAGRLAHGSDIIYLPYDPASERVKTEDINTLAGDCYIKPYGGDHKIYIIKNAHTMTDQAQNKLLKTLEEPPKGVVIILVAANPRQLLATVHSRTRKITVKPYNTESVYKHLIDNGIEEDAAGLSAVYGGGNLSETQRILSDGKSAMAVSLIFSMLLNMQRSPDILHYSALFSKYSDMKGEMPDYMLIAVRDVMSAAAGQPGLAFTKSRADDIMKIAAAYPAEACAAVIEKISYAKKRLYYNCNYQGVIDELLFAITEVRAIYADSNRD